MPRRDHLVPSMTVDRNGHARTVYVNPGAEPRGTGALAATLPTVSADAEEEWDGFADPDRWQDNDFCCADAIEWEGNGFTADDAADWRAQEFGPDEAAHWRGAGFDAEDSEAWHGAGLQPAEAKGWETLGLLPDDAKEWRAAGIEGPEDAKSWEGNGFDPETAKEWREGGFTDPDDAQAWREGSKQANRVDFEALKELQRLGAEAEDAAIWLNLLDDVHGMEGGKDETIEDLWRTMDGEFPGAGEEYRHYFPYRQWGILSSAGIDATVAYRVKDVHDAIDEYRQEQDGDDYEEDSDACLELACDWFRGSDIMVYKTPVVVALVAAGETPESCGPFLRDHEYESYYAGDAEDVVWACRMASSLGSPELRDEAFRPLFRAIRGSDWIREIAAEHGTAKVEAALHAGLQTEAQLRSFLEDIAVGEISEGAL